MSRTHSIGQTSSLSKSNPPASSRRVTRSQSRELVKGDFQQLKPSKSASRPILEESDNDGDKTLQPEEGDSNGKNGIFSVLPTLHHLCLIVGSLSDWGLCIFHDAELRSFLTSVIITILA